MIKVEIISDYQLSPEDLAEHGDGHNLLKVFHNEKLIMTATDYGEPEDNTFFRDWDWIKDALIKMYEIGKAEGGENLNEGLKQLKDILVLLYEKADCKGEQK